MDAKIMENEATVRANARLYRDRQAALSARKGIMGKGTARGYWQKGLHNVLMLIVERLD